MKVKNFSFSKSRKLVFGVVLLACFLLPLGISANAAVTNTEIGEAISDVSIFDTDIELDDSKLDGYLSDYIRSQKQIDGLNYIDGKLSVQLLIAEDPTLGGKIDPITVIELDDGYYYVHTTVDSAAEIEMLESDELVLKAGADKYYGPDKADPQEVIDQLNFGEAQSFLPKDDIMRAEIVRPTSVETREILGVNDVLDLNYNGSGVLVNVHDTGVDFGHTALTESMAVDDDGYPLSFEPSGRMSFTNLWSYDYWMDIYNNPKDNPEGYSEYVTGLIEGWFSPRHTDADGNLTLSGTGNLKVFGADLGSVYSLSQFGISLPSNYYVGSLPGNETGFAYGMSVIHNDGWIQFVPFLEADSDDDGIYDTLYVDYETGFAITMAWQYDDDSWLDYATYDFSTQVAVKNNENLALSKDIWDMETVGVLDGYRDISIGSIGNVYDSNDFVDDDVLLGIPADGKALGHLWDVGGHGTGCSGYVAAALTDYQLQEHEDISSDTYFTIGGMAPEANIVATAGFSDTATILGWLWACGFDFDANDETVFGVWGGTWVYNPESTHAVNISSNSWGTSAVMDQNGIAMGWDFESMFIDYLSAPGYIHEDYQGVLFLTSTGNGGSGMGTSKQPSQSTAAVAVGASTVNWWRNSTGYNATEQGFDHVIGWSDNGPAVTGYPKIDIVAPGAFDYSLTPVVPGDGGPYFTIFGGTSASCPVVAGGMALAYQAWNLAFPGVPLTPDMAKVILKSTAKDLGYDPYMQGSGRIDVYAMVDYIKDLTGDEIIAFSYDPQAVAVGRNFYNFYNIWFGELPPAAVQPLADTAIYGGNLFAGEISTSELIIEGATSVDYEAVTFETTYTIVNDSTDLTTAEFYTPFALADVFDIAQLRSADYFQLEFSIPYELGDYYRSEFGGDPPYMYVSSLESGTIGDGDEAWAFWNYAYDNNNFQDLFLPTNFIQDTEDPVYVRIRDRGFTLNETGGLVHPDWTGCNFTLSVRAFTRVTDPQVSFTVETPGPTYTNLTVDITVDGAAVPGMYEGYIIVNSSDTNEVLVPYGYSVKALVEEYNVDGWTYLSDGFLTDRPNDNGLYGCADYDWRPETGDWRFYDFALENESAASTIALELEWVNPGSELNMWILDNDGWMLDYTKYLTNGGQYISDLNAGDTMQRLLLEAPGYASSVYTVIVHATTLNPTSETVPLENFTLKVTYLNDTIDTFAVPDITIDTPLNVLSSTGAYVSNETVDVEWDEVSTNPLPEFVNDVINNTLSIVPGLFVEHADEMQPEDMIPNAGAIIPEYTEMVYLMAGDFVSGTLSWEDTSDFDYLIIQAGAPYDFDYDIFGAPACTGANPEHFEGTIPAEGWYELVVEYYDGPMTPVNYLMEFSVLGDEVFFADVDPGDMMSFNFTKANMTQGTFAFTTTSSGWNFASTISGKIIYDTGAPVIDAPAAVGAYGYWNEFEFLIEEATEGTYTIVVDDDYELVSDAEFASTSFIDFEYYGYADGDHEFNITVVDMLGYETSVIMDVYINWAPDLLYLDTDETGFMFAADDWDMVAGLYEVYVDDALNVTGAIADYEDIYVNTTTWAEGSYFVEVLVIDEYDYGFIVGFNLLIVAGPIEIVTENVTVTETVTVTVTEPCTETDTETETEPEGGGIPGFGIGMLIVVSLGAVVLVGRKSKRS